MKYNQLNLNIMTKYSSKASDKIGDVMHEYKKGSLKSSSGDKVKSRKQAIAIGISEAREKGYKTPSKRSTSASSSSTRKKSSSGKSASSRKSTASRSRSK